MSQRRKGIKPTGMRNQFRIIGGRWRGVKLDFPMVEAIRPTPDRVRETLFNWLQPDIANARCLDLFAGSGALGFEALSRGADQVAFVDQESKVCQSIDENLKRLGVSQGQTHCQSAITYLKGRAEPFDLLFLDPPFHQEMVYPICQTLEKEHWLKPFAWIYIESEMAVEETQLPSEKWQVYRRKQAGQVHYTLISFSTETS